MAGYHPCSALGFTLRVRRSRGSWEGDNQGRKLNSAFNSFVQDYRIVLHLVGNTVFLEGQTRLAERCAQQLGASLLARLSVGVEQRPLLALQRSCVHMAATSDPLLARPGGERLARLTLQALCLALTLLDISNPGPNPFAILNSEPLA